MVGTPEKIVHQVPLDRVKHRPGVEAGNEHERAPEPHCRVEHAGQAEHVEHREYRDPDVVIFETEQLAGHGAVHVQLEMG